MAGLAMASPKCVRESGFWNPGNLSFWHQEPGKFLPVESGIQGFGIRNSGQANWNPANDYDPESQFH